MTRKISTTRWIGNYISKKVFKPDVFYIVKKEKDKTSHISPVFNLLDYKVGSLDIDQIRMAVIRAKQDYGEAFEKLAAED